MRKTAILLLLLTVSFQSADAANQRLRSHQMATTITEDDVRAEIEFGREVAARILGKYRLYKNDHLTRYANILAKAMALSLNRPELAFTVGILDTDVINAFSAPGGYIFVTRGSIDAMKNEAEFAAVLAHEMIHISEKHIVKELNIKASESSAISGMGRLVGGATDALKMTFLQSVDQAVKILFERGYKKKDEIEADTLGTLLIASMEYDPQALVKYFDRIKSATKEGTDSMSELHPSFEERMEWITKAITDNGLEGVDYKTAKGRFNKNVKTEM